MIPNARPLKPYPPATSFSRNLDHLKPHSSGLGSSQTNIRRHPHPPAAGTYVPTRCSIIRITHFEIQTGASEHATTASSSGVRHQRRRRRQCRSPRHAHVRPCIVSAGVRGVIAAHGAERRPEQMSAVRASQRRERTCLDDPPGDGPPPRSTPPGDPRSPRTRL